MTVWRNREGGKISGKKGYTLVEVVAAVGILMLAAEIIFMAVSFAARMHGRAEEARRAAIEVYSRENGVAARFFLPIFAEEEPAEGNGYLYRQSDADESGALQIQTLWVELPKEEGSEAGEWEE